jgi:hypothetical protein
MTALTTIRLTDGRTISGPVLEWREGSVAVIRFRGKRLAGRRVYVAPPQPRKDRL